MSDATDQPAPSSSALHRLIAHPAVKIAVPLLIVGIAFFALRDLARHVTWSDVRTDLSAVPPLSLALAVLWTCVSYFAISFYDIFAVESVARGKVPVPIAGYAGASGYAVSNLLGFSYITGTAVRYRIYGALGLDLHLVAGVLATSWIAIWLGLTLILGVLMVFHPLGLSVVTALSDQAETAIGIALLVGFSGFMLWLSLGHKRFSVGSFGFDLPDFRLASLLTLAAVIDVLGAALTLYVLLPDAVAQNFPYFFVIFVAAIALGILSHAPGGLGVFEATIILGLGATNRSDVLAALLLYRLIYTLLPFLVAAASQAYLWSRAKKDKVMESASLTVQIMQPLVPLIAAGITLLAGILLMISGSLPTAEGRLAALREILPLPFIELSHIAGGVIGLLLIVLSRGLYRKLYRAWLVSMSLMALGLLVSLTRGLRWEDALWLALSLGLLGAFRSAFYREEAGTLFRLNLAWMLSAVAILAVVIWIGFMDYSGVDYDNSLWWSFTWDGHAARFLRTALILVLILAALGLNSFLSGKAQSFTPDPIPEAVHRLLAECEDTEAQLSLTGDKAFLIAEDESAFLAYADTGKSLIAKGEPVGAFDAGEALIWALREKADREGKRCAFYSVTTAYLPTFLDLGLSILKIGEVARIDLSGFSLKGPSKKALRYARSRAARDGYVFQIIPRAEVPAILPQLRQISDAWLLSKQGEEKQFSLGAFSNEYMSYFDQAVLRHEETGQIVAFTNMMTGANKHEISLDLMRYDPAGPSVAMDALFAEMMVWAAEQGYSWFSLGAAPFSGIDNRRLASHWNRVGGFLYEHGERFYHFEGLRAYKEKFDPVWTPNFLASPGGLAAATILYEINILVSGGFKGLLK